MKETVIVSAIILLVLGLAIFYVVRGKKNGRKCIGCPDGATCPAAKSGVCSCGTTKKNTDKNRKTNLHSKFK